MDFQLFCLVSPFLLSYNVLLLSVKESRDLVNLAITWIIKQSLQTVISKYEASKIYLHKNITLLFVYGNFLAMYLTTPLFNSY